MKSNTIGQNTNASPAANAAGEHLTTADKLQIMKEVEERNDERIRAHEALWARCGSQYVAAEYLVQAAQEAE